MLPLEILRVSLAALAAHKLRSALTMLGIAIGVFSVVGVMTAIQAMESSIQSGLSFLGSNIAQIQKLPVVQGRGGNRERFENRRDIDYAQARRFVERMDGSGARVCLKLFLRGATQAQYAGRSTNPNLFLVGTDENFIYANQYEIALGRNLTSEDVALGRDVIVLGDDARRRLFPDQNPLGEVVRVRGSRFVVVGVFAEKGASFAGNPDNVLAIPITSMLGNFGARQRSVSIAVQSPDQRSYSATVDRAVGAMRTVRGLGPEDPEDFEVFSNDSLINIFNEISGVVSSGAFVISLVALLAAGVGIMNIMLVSVTERTREIGVRKSLGAKRRDILRQFLAEAVVVSQGGGLLGLAGGIVAGNAVAVYLQAEAIFPWGWAAAGIAVCCVIGVAFGLYPAWKAARLDPVEALRYE